MDNSLVQTTLCKNFCLIVRNFYYSLKNVIGMYTLNRVVKYSIYKKKSQ